MIDTKELRRLAQAATPGPWIAAGPSFGESLPKYLNEVVVDREGDEDDGYSICNTPIGLELSSDMAFIAAANPAAISELLDRLEVAEKDIALKERVIDSLGSTLNAAANEREALRTELAVLRSSMTFRTSLIGRIEAERDALCAKIEAMEKQEPYSYIYEYANPIDGSPVWRDTPGYWNAQYPRSSKPLYALPGAQPAPSICPAVLSPVINWLRNGCDPMKAAEELELIAAAATPEAKR